MKHLLKAKAGIGMFNIVIEVVLVVALIPVVKTFIAGAENLTTTETVLLGLTTLFIVLGLIYAVGRQTGLIKGSK